MAPSYDLTAARICGIVGALVASGLATLADQAMSAVLTKCVFPGTADGTTPRRRLRPVPPTSNSVPRPSAPNAQIVTRYILRKLRCSPARWAARQCHVLQTHEPNDERSPWASTACPLVQINDPGRNSRQK